MFLNLTSVMDVYTAANMCKVGLISVLRIHMFLGLPDPHPDPLVRDMEPDPDPSIMKQK
jgi:hypothetical protein